MKWQNEFTKKINIKFPFIQAPMLGVSTPEMAAVVSNLGGLGSIPVGGLSPEMTLDLIHQTRGLTDKPFAVNLFAHKIPEHDPKDLELMQKFILALAREKGYELSESDLSGFRFYTYEDQMEILLNEKIPVVSFTFGCLEKKDIKQLQENGSILIGTATCLEEAIILEENKIDYICVQGIEAGGHRGTFIDDIELPQKGLFSLLEEFRGKVKTPLIAAGGLNSPEIIKGVMELGVIAVQVGTAFIGTVESVAIPAYKNYLAEVNSADTVLTKAFSGRWARGIKNEFMERIAKSGLKIPPYPYQNSLTTKLRKLAQQNNDRDYTNLWAGQAVGKKEPKNSRDVFLALMRNFIGL